jgi:hypothetical protein
VTFTQFTQTDVSYTATIRLKSGAGAITTAGTTTGTVDNTPLIKFDGVDNLIFDGREGGTGTTIADNKWTISNTYYRGTTFTFINDAIGNTLKYCNIQGANYLVASGTIMFAGTTANGVGNDTNTIDHCAIYDGATKPNTAIYSFGRSGAAANSENIISNNHIYNFNSRFSQPTTSGINLAAYSSVWTITGNSFYQTSANSASTYTVTVYGIRIAGVYGHTIAGNYIGGSLPNCGDAAWTADGTKADTRFNGIYLSVYNTTTGAPLDSYVKNNTISNFDWSSKGGGTPVLKEGSFCGINVYGNGTGAQGTVYVENNTIGGAANDIKFTSLETAQTLTGIFLYGFVLDVSFNILSGLANLTTEDIGTSVQGIATAITPEKGTYNIYSNRIGSPTEANSLYAGSPSATGAAVVKGLYITATGTTLISNNTCASFFADGSGAGSSVMGIDYIRPAGVAITKITISQNTIRDISTSGANIFTDQTASVIGISTNTATSLETSTTATILQNTIYNLSNSNTTSGVCVYGILHKSITENTDIIANNSICGLSLVSASGSAEIRGINFLSGNASIYNNVISLGFFDCGTIPIKNAVAMTGMYVVANTAGSGIYFNTVYIGGSGVAGSIDTYAFRSDEATNNRTIQNNIFYTDRSNSSGTGKNYAVRVAGKTGLTIDYNDYYATGTGAVFGYIGADIATLAAWKTSTGQDVHSRNVLLADPTLVSGIAVPGISTDFSGKIRADIPTIGAYELTLLDASWTGNISTDWNTLWNWSGGAVPSPSTDVYIPSGTIFSPVVNQPSASPAVCKNLTIAVDATLTIAAAKALTVNGDFTNNATSAGLLIQSDATGIGSLIIVGSVSGSATVQRWMNAGAWNMVSSPLLWQSVEDFLTANNNILTDNGTRAMTDYNPVSNTWNSFFTDGSANGNLGDGKGFSMRVEPSDAAVTFTGSILAGSAPVFGLTADKWNCIGNPYTSAIGISSTSSSTRKFINANVTDAANLDPVYGAVYVCDQLDASNLTGKYTAVNNVSGAFEVQQGQAFFVKMNTAATSVSFTPAMQIHKGDLILESAEFPWPTIKLVIKKGSLSGETVIAFNSAMTKGLDPTYDAGLFKGGSDLVVYSSLVEDIGIPFAIQALPDNSYSSMVIPVGVDFKTGGEVVFSAQSFNLPAECEVILVDKVNKTVTDLSKDSYTISLPANSIVTDRFQIHTSTLTTGINPNLSAGNLNAYAIRNIEIHVKGEVSKNAVATLYDIQGRVVLVKNMEEGSLNVIQTPNLKTGIYMLFVKDNQKVQRFKLPVNK